MSVSWANDQTSKLNMFSPLNLVEFAVDPLGSLIDLYSSGTSVFKSITTAPLLAPEDGPAEPLLLTIALSLNASTVNDTVPTAAQPPCTISLPLAVELLP